MFVDLVKLICVLFIVVIGYIASGITENILIKNECFDLHRLVNGILKALAACMCLIVVSFIFSIFDLSGLGFEPETAITAGILVYSGKLLQNAMGLLGLDKNGCEIGCDEDDSNDETFTPSNDNNHIAG